MQQQQQPSKKQTAVSRRNLLRNTAAAGAAAATFASLGSNFAWAQVSEEIKVGVIGAGGRASGAVGNHMEAIESLGLKAKVVSLCDMFPAPAKRLAEKWKVPADKVYTGLDGYKQVVNSDCEIVLTATPPGFRPIHFEAAVDAGKHVFFEKPVAVDPAGVRKVIAAGERAKQKGLTCVTGTQRRHETNYMDTIKAIHDGAIGDILHMSIYWCGGGIWWRKREPGMTDMEYQIHNWYHHIWLSGDQIVEQHIHNIDVANWVLDSHPISAFGVGGRQVRKEPGEIWDHTAVEYEYANGARVLSFGRHWPASTDNISEFAIGTKGTSNPGGWIQPKGGEKRSFKNQKSGYVQEHIDLLKAIKSGKPINEAQRIAETTLTAIIGRMSCYTGKKVSWDFALNESKLDTMPKDINKDMPPPPIDIPEPGKTKLI
jgi:predicted dehydrogenase